MTLYGYTIQEEAAAAFLLRCRDLVEARDAARWGELARTFARLYPRLLIKSRQAQTTLVGPPLAKASHYRAELPDLPEDVVPEWSHPALQWLLMNVLLQASRHRLYVTFDHFAFALDDGEFRRLVGPDALPELNHLLSTLLASRRPPPESIACLSSAAHVQSYCTASDVQELMAMETTHALLERTSSHLMNQEHFVSHHLGADLRRLLLFLRTAAHEKSAVFMTPHPVEL